MGDYLKTLSILLLLSASTRAQIEPGDFTADFESGNISNVQQVGADSFNFAIRLDDNHGDTYGWYYFAIVGDSGRTATLFLTNPDSWQNEYCNPLYSNDNRNWQRVSSVWRAGRSVVFRQTLGADTVWFAQDFPFTVTQAYAYMDTLNQLYGVRIDTLGYSVHNRPLKMLTLTNEDVPAENKKTVWLISRQHCMESPATFLLHGLLEEVVSSSVFANYWRNDIILKVVPIGNPDGVAEGYSRHNVNGVNLNRDWHDNFSLEEPEVRAMHQALDDYIMSGHNVDIFMDLHASPDYADYGFRMSLDYTSIPYFNNQETFLRLLETYDQWQDRLLWRDLDTNYAFGVSCVVAYDMYALDTYSSELPWTKRADGSFITIQTLHEQGPAWGVAIYNYIFPLNINDENNARMDTIEAGDTFIPVVRDYDQRTRSSLLVAAYCPQSADSETVVLYRRNNEGQFTPQNPIQTNSLPAVRGDSILSLLPGSELRVTYIDPNLQSRICTRILPVTGCLYLAGDVNNNGQTNGVDAIYLVNYLKGSAEPPLACDCPPNGMLFAAADVNGSCSVNGIDVGYLVNFFKGGPVLLSCPDCPAH